MMWRDVLDRLRFLLRDPDGDLHTEEQLRRWWNETQNEVQQRTHFLLRVEAHRYPPLYDWTIGQEWEREYVEGDIAQGHLEWVGSSDLRVVYPWEPAYLRDDMETPDDGTRHTQAWESLYCTPADYIPIPLHARFEQMRFAAFDREHITPATEKELSDRDAWYRTTTGEVIHYWRPDQYHNQVVLYPHPGSPEIQPLPEPYDILSVDGDGVVSSDDEELDRRDTGIAVDIVELDDALFCVYEPIPNPVEDLMTEIDWPEWTAKYIEYGVLERAYGADTDSFIPSLRDYWAQRKQVGILALRRFSLGRLKDRTFVIGQGVTGKTIRSRVRLPQGYPAVWP